jgi:DNA-binding response OmpR family regulator
MKVLVVEDETLVAIEMAQCVKKAGFEVCGIANNPDEAYKLAHKYKPQIIIMDINLGAEENGVDVVFNLNKTLNASVIYLTAYHDKNTLEEVAKTQFVQYIIKPYKQTELVSTLKLTALRCTSYSDDLGYGYSYNPHNRELTCKEQVVNLSHKESQLFHLLYLAKGTLVNVHTIDYEIWSDKVVTETTRRTLLHRLRQKTPHFKITKESNAGYRLIV